MSGDDYPSFSPAEFDRRHAATRELMEREGCDALLFFGTSAQGGTGQADIYYLSHHMGRQENILLFFAGRDPVLLVESFNHVPNALRQSVIEDTRYGGPKTQFAATIVDVIRESGSAPNRIGIVGWMPYQVYDPLSGALSDAEFKDVTRGFRGLRLKKSAEEIDWLHEGAARTDAAMVAMAEGMRPGMKEYELGFLLAEGYRSRGGEDYLHYISSTPQDDPDRCAPAQTASRRTLAAGDVIAIELSIGYWGYAGQALRTIVLQAEPNDLYADLYRVAEEAYYRMCEVLKPGATTADVLSAAEVIDERGYAIVDGLLHGYGIGLLPPSVPGEGFPKTLTRPVRMGGEQQRHFEFEKDMTVVVQPNVVTEDGRAGVQIGNLLRISDDGTESFHSCPFEFIRT